MTTLFAGMFVTRGFLKQPSVRRYLAQQPSSEAGTTHRGEHAGSLSFSPSSRAASLYSEHCAVCHNSVNNTGAPREDALRRLTPERILAVLETGSMRTQGFSRTATERQAIATWLGHGRIELTAAVPARTCLGIDVAMAADALPRPHWNGWGGEADNSRSQTAVSAGMTWADLNRLQLAWAFAFRDDEIAFAQPTVVGRRVFVGSASGKVYALDARTGCTYWTFQAGAGVRTAVSIGSQERNHDRSYSAYFGDLHGEVYAVDAQSGRLIWRRKLEVHSEARITGAPQLDKDRLYVPMASSEEDTAVDPNYPCCTFRGSVTAVDTRTGKTLWKTYTIPEKAQPTRTSRAGTQLWGPSGAGIWSTPTLDQKRRCLYAATGDSYSDPVASNSDAVVAFDLDSGAIRWSNQTISNDASNDGCTALDRSNCPTENGPDYDFGSSPVMVVLPDGREMLLVGQKSGIVYAMDPNNKGHIVWQSRVGKGGRLGGVQWGMAAGEGALYAAISDASFKRANNPSDAPSRRMGTGMELDPHRGGGLTALRLSDGKPLWRATPAGQGPWWHFGLFALPDPCAGRQPCSPAQTAAVTHIPGAVLSGALDGHMRAYSSFDGHILWDYDTVREYTTVNGGKAHGGSLDGPGATVVDGMVYLNSGYGWWYGTPGNVLLAFSIAAIDKKLR